MGYPRFSALMASQPSYIISRRFTNARVRLLLYKQDEIAVLEEKLASIDNSEPREQFLGSRRRDVNTERKETMRDLGKLLAEYGPSLRFQWGRYRLGGQC